MTGPDGASMEVRTHTGLAVAMLESFIAAVVAALVITLSSVSPAVQSIAVAAVTPIILASLVLVYFCRKGRAWSFLGASVLGALGVALRLVVNAQPSLEVGGGLSLGVTALYIGLGAFMSLTNFMAFMELRAPGRGANRQASPESSYRVARPWPHWLESS